MLSRLKRMKKNKKGFTLIELIVVIAILAILAVVTVPRIVGFIDSAGDSAELANGRMLYNATVLALSNEEITVPTSASLSITAIPGSGNGSALDNYLDEWPTDRDGNALLLKINSSGKAEVELVDDDNTHLAGADF